MFSEYENLKGHSLLIVESMYVAGVIHSKCFNSQMRLIDFKEDVPKNLTQYLSDKDIDVALIHTARLSDKGEILDAHHNGKRIVVILT